MGSQVYGFFTIIFILLCLWFLAYIMTKFMGKKTKSAMKSKYMQVIDTMSIGFDRTLYLVKVGEQYVLMYSSTKGFEYICNLNSNALSFSGESFEADEQPNGGFAKYFDFFRPGTESRISKEDNEVENNVERLKRLFNRKD